MPYDVVLYDVVLYDVVLGWFRTV